MNHDHIDRLNQLAATQAGLASRQQAADLGIPKRVIDTLLRSRRLSLVAPRVLGFPGVPATPERRLWIGYLDTGPSSVVSHRSAGFLHGLPGMPPPHQGRVDILVPHPLHLDHRVAFVHQTRDPWPVEQVEIAGLPVTDVGRTVIDLAAVIRPGHLGKVVEHVLDDKLVRHDEMVCRFTSLLRPGKRGLVTLGGWLDHYRPGPIVTTTYLERVSNDLLGRSGLPLPRGQFAFPGRELPDGAVDFAWPEATLVWEVDGRSYHRRARALRRDRYRDQAAARAGWQVLRSGYDDVTHTPDLVLAALDVTYHQRVRLRAA